MQFIYVLKTVLLLLVLGKPSRAAAPSNDLIANAKIVSLPFEEEIDTTEATTDSDDSELADQLDFPCSDYGRFIDASVWYKYTATADILVGIDAEKSSFVVNFLVGEGSPGSLTNFVCSAVAMKFSASAGTTYYVLAFDGQGNDSSGGQLKISFLELAEAPLLTSLTVNPTWTFRTIRRFPIISGTYKCKCPGYSNCFTAVSVEATQHYNSSSNKTPVKGGETYGFFGICNGTENSWRAIILPTAWGRSWLGYARAFDRSDLNVTASARVNDQFGQFSETENEANKIVKYERRPSF